MRYRITYFLFAFVVHFVFIACRDEKISHDGLHSLSFSADTLVFDTIFTESGSCTRSLRLFNTHSRSVEISRVWFASGESEGESHFHVNIDGESDLQRMTGIVVNAHDSAYIFVSVYIDPTDARTPIVVEDNLNILVNGNVVVLHLEAVGRNVIRIASKERMSEYDTLVLESSLPYLIYDTVVVKERLEIKSGAELFMHYGAAIIVYGDVRAVGSLGSPIRMCCDRLDKFSHTYIKDSRDKERATYSIPYSYLAGQWGGMYFICDSMSQWGARYELEYVEIVGAEMGVYCENTHPSFRPTLQMRNALVHNNSGCGVVVNRVDANIYNTEISNNGRYALYDYGSALDCNHVTVANFYGCKSSDIPYRSGLFVSVPAVRIIVDSISGGVMPVSISNSIITGCDTNNLHIDSLLEESVVVRNCYLRCDSFSYASCADNIFMQGGEDTNNVFRYADFLYSQHYFDFHLDSLSPARGIGDGVISEDRDGKMRGNPSDAGCYEYAE